ncbi:MAG: flavin reductase family protein [Thermoproteota archaeon]|nr:flavin reductase family protein [Thermoproteota archaeon]
MKKVLPLKPPEGVSSVVEEHWIEVNFVLPQPIMIVTTVDRKGNVNAALKSWVMYCSTDHVMFGCSTKHDTAKNLLETGEFVVNLPSSQLLEQTKMTAIDYPRGVDEAEKAGLTEIPSIKVKPPRIKECKAHLECKLIWHKKLGNTGIIFVGKAVALSVDEDVLSREKYAKTEAVKEMLLIPEGIGMIRKIEPLGPVPKIRMEG